MSAVRNVITVIGVVIALAFMALSAAINWRYGHSLGRDPADQTIFAAISLVADLAKALTPFFFWYALTNRNYLPALAAAALWIACTGYSLSSAAGFAELNRATQVGVLSNKKDTYRDLQADLSRKQQQLTALGTYEPPTVVQARVDALKQNPRWISSNACTDTTTKLSRELCTDIARLEGERQKGLTGSRLESEIGDLRLRIETLAPASRIEGGDPRAGFLTRLFGWDILNVQTGFSLLFIAVLELGSGLGLFIALSHGELARAIKTGHLPAPEEEATPPRALPGPSEQAAPATASVRQPAIRQASRKEAAKPAQAKPPPAAAPLAASSQHAAPAITPAPSGDVAKFAVARLAAEEGASISFGDLYAAYGVWCAAQTVPALPRPEFDTRFMVLADQVDFHHEERGGQRICTDLRLK